MCILLLHGEVVGFWMHFCIDLGFGGGVFFFFPPSPQAM